MEPSFCCPLFDFGIMMKKCLAPKKEIYIKTHKITALAGVLTVFAVLGFVFIGCGDNGGTPHSTHTWGNWQETLAPDCETAGEEKRVCSVCGETQIQPKSALGHNYKWTITTMATITEDGEETETCSHNTEHTRNTQSIPSVNSLITALDGTYTQDTPAELTVKIDLEDMDTDPPVPWTEQSLTQVLIYLARKK